MFSFAYLPQLAILVFVNGPLAVVTTVFLILNESATIVNMVSRNYLLQDALLDTFDGTLLARNKAALVREGREVRSGSDPIGKLGKILKSPFGKFSPKAIVRYFMYLPLNFIPVVGTVIFIFLQARGRGKGVHDRVSIPLKIAHVPPCSMLTPFESSSNSRSGRLLNDRIGSTSTRGLTQRMSIDPPSSPNAYHRGVYL